MTKLTNSSSIPVITTSRLPGMRESSAGGRMSCIVGFWGSDAATVGSQDRRRAAALPWAYQFDYDLGAFA